MNISFISIRILITILLMSNTNSSDMLSKSCKLFLNESWHNHLERVPPSYVTKIVPIFKLHYTIPNTTLQCITQNHSIMLCKKSNTFMVCTYLPLHFYIYTIYVYIDYVLHILMMEATYLDGCYISGRWVLHIWRTATDLDDCNTPGRL